MTSRPNIAHLPPASAHRCTDDIVLISMPLRDDVNRETLSRFGEDHWDMQPAILSSHGRRLAHVLDFTEIACPLERLTAKEYIFASLNIRFGGKARRLHPGSARAALLKLQRFVSFVRVRNGQFDVSTIDQETIDAYRQSLVSTIVGEPQQVARYLKPIVELRRLGPYLTCGGLNLLPWAGRPLYRVLGCSQPGPENRTPRIPEPVIGTLLCWAIKYVDVFSRDILAARAELKVLQDRHAERSRLRKNDVIERVQTWISSRRNMCRGVPVWNEPSVVSGNAQKLAKGVNLNGEVINFQLIVLQTGLNAQTIQENSRALALIGEAVSELGIEKGGMDTPIWIDPDTGLPWRSRFDQHNLLIEEKYLQTAAYILCAYLTGMRDNEIQAMRIGAVKCSRSQDGLVERLAVRSTVYKGRGSRGEAAEWITIAPVDRAVAVAERLAEHHARQHRGDELWTAIAGRRSGCQAGLPYIVKWINKFRTLIDERYGTIDRPVFPRVDGRPWSFNTLQFRRTLAWYIANRPFGVVAGKIQYKHASVAMFDGYAGSSASGFRQEVEQERALGQIDDIVEHYEAHSRAERRAGPAAVRISSEFDRVQREIGPLPGRIVDKQRVKAMLAHLGRTLHVGHLTDCFFDPSTAMCLRKQGLERPTAPMLSQCAPDRCPNSCMTQRHVPVWEASIAEAEELLKVGRLSRAQRDALESDNERKRRLIAPLKESVR